MATQILDSPVSPTVSSVLVGDVNPLGITIADLVVDGSITDPDGAAVEAIAIEAVNTSLGRWQYSLNKGTTWLTIRAELIKSMTNMLWLLRVQKNKIWLLSIGNMNGSLNDAITFRA